MSSSVVYLLGYPGVGKYTIACEIARRTGACLVDNQLINTPILSVLKWDGKSRLPAAVWDRITPIRDVVLATIEELAPPTLSYVLTNVLVETDQDIALYDRIETIAARRGSVFVPVLLSCDLDEQVRRVVAPDRAQRFKWSDAEAVRAYLHTKRLYRPQHPNLLMLDTTGIAPAEAAEAVIGHIASCAEQAARSIGRVDPQSRKRH